MTNTIKLIHLGWMHALPFAAEETTSEYFEDMVKSQIKVANYIKNHPNSLVFLEGLTESYSGIPSNTFVARMLFPDGLPDDAAKLSSLQKKYLYDMEDAVRTMLYLGELKSIHRTISPEQAEVVDIRVREKAAVECIQEELKISHFG